MAYCRNPNKEESWFSEHNHSWESMIQTLMTMYAAEFDDAKVTEIKEEAIVPLEGGGEGPIAYLLLYKAKSLK